MKARGFDDRLLGMRASLIVEELRKGLDSARHVYAETLFRAEVAAERIQFRLRLDGRNWRMPFFVETTEAENARQLLGQNGTALEKSLFAPVYENELNSEERDVAVYIDGDGALHWWHRNVARVQYGIQGWRKAKIYPDFIFSAQQNDEVRRITILETKGDQLDNLDTDYKRKLLEFLSQSFRWDETTSVGELELIQDTGEIVYGALVLMSKWKSEVPNLLSGN